MKRRYPRDEHGQMQLPTGQWVPDPDVDPNGYARAMYQLNKGTYKQKPDKPRTTDEMVKDLTIGLEDIERRFKAWSNS